MNTDPATDATNKTSGNEKEPFRLRLWRLIKHKSSFAEWCIVLFTAVLAGSAIYQFTIMRGQLDQMQSTNRPYIFTTAKFSFPQVPTPETLREIPVTVYMLNVGISPALDVVNNEPIVGLNTDSDVSEHLRTCFFTYPQKEGLPLPPNQSFTTGAGITSHTITRTLSEEERKDVVNQTKHLIVLGGYQILGCKGWRLRDYVLLYLESRIP